MLFPYSLSDFNNGLSEEKEAETYDLCTISLCFFLGQVLQGQTLMWCLLLVEQMYIQVGINSFLTADLASFIYCCKMMLEKSSRENETGFYWNIIYLSSNNSCK